MTDTAENTISPYPLQRDANYINITEPFEGDLLNRKPLAEHLTRYIDRLQVGAVLALDARWGEGKTWFVQHWKAHLEQTQTPHNVIYLNAFSQDYLEDPFMVLSAEITHAFDNANDEHELIKTFKEKATSATKALLPELPKLMLSMGMTLLGAGYLGKTIENAVHTAKDAIGSVQETYGEEVLDGLTETIDENITKAIQKRFENHEADKQTLQAFKQSLHDLANNEELNPQPLVFIIDELDRCNPLFSVRLIERIKHFFDIPNIVFVLVTDKTQLQATICHQFGYNQAAGEAYLDKFIDFSIRLAKPSLEKDNFLMLITDKMDQLGLKENIIFHLKQDCLVYKAIFNTSIRRIHKILNLFSLLKFDDLNRNRLLLYKLFSFKIVNHPNIFLSICYIFYIFPNKDYPIVPNNSHIEDFEKQIQTYNNDSLDYDINFKPEKFQKELLTYPTYKMAYEVLTQILKEDSDWNDEVNQYSNQDICIGVIDIHNSPNQSYIQKLLPFSPYSNITYTSIPSFNLLWDKYIHMIIDE